MELKEGHILEGGTERWQVKGFLGQGKCCTVYEACCNEGSLNGGARAAVKVYKKEERYASAGMNEATLLQMLHRDERPHCREGRPFIVSILDVFFWEGHLCLLNECLSQSLHSIFAIHGCHGNGLPLYVVQKCCRDLSRGLEYLKEKRVIHADIKPTNLMWNSETELFQFVDFGLSFIEEKQPFQQIQSPGYQSPEVKQWNQNIMTAKTQVNMCDCSCDTWSMACVLFLLYSGQHLFQPEEDIPLVCNNCQKDGTCIHSLRLKSRLTDNLPSKWIMLKEVTRQHHDTIIDLLSKMLVCKPSQRITPDNIRSHPFLNATNSIRYPSLTDLVVLPTKVLQLTNMFEKHDELKDSEEYEEFLEDIRQECERFGAVKSIRVPFLDDANACDPGLLGKVFVEFSNSKDCESARHELTGRTFNERTVVTSYFPINHFKQGEFY